MLHTARLSSFSFRHDTMFFIQTRLFEFLKIQLFLVAISLLTACQKVQPFAPALTTPPEVKLPASIEQLEPVQAASWLSQHTGAMVLDLRMLEEIQREGRIEGTVHHDFLQHDTFQSWLATLNKERPTLLVCALGGRSEQAALEMSNQGFTQLALIKGGQEAWQAAGLPVQK